MLEQAALEASRYEPIDVGRYRADLLAIIEAVRAAPSFDARALRHILRRHPRDGSGFFSKGQLVAAYRALVEAGDLPFERATFSRLQMKPVRTQSGVAVVAVLTQPAGCPGRCIFCPDDASMPKSYLAREPGAQRALRHSFDPYQQTRSRLAALHNTGHPTDKVELLILGGTWGAYSHSYGAWFIQRCLDALNGSDSESLHEAQRRNQQAPNRCVGLTIETRPDWVTPDEVLRLRRLGVTRVQLGVQSLDDRILALNGRGHDVEATRRACRLLRAAGFKLHLHWMPNLFGATPQSDRADFARFFDDPAICPDELKIYPCSLLAGTPLYDHYLAGDYQPYSEEQLVDLLADVKPTIPPYTRINRLFRDIPAHHIQAGVKLSNLRQVVQEELARRGQRCGCIRCREIRRRDVRPEQLSLQVQRYDTDLTSEYFLHFVTNQRGAEQGIEPGLIAAFLRLSLPCEPQAGSRAFLEEIAGSALIREVHVYGPALSIGDEKPGAAQHNGLGSQLLDAAAQISRRQGFRRLSVIAATGTRGYYAARGFTLCELYMHKELT